MIDPTTVSYPLAGGGPQYPKNSCAGFVERICFLWASCIAGVIAMYVIVQLSIASIAMLTVGLVTANPLLTIIGGVALGVLALTVITGSIKYSIESKKYSY
ncbi:MAG: hypothetical protein MRY21_05385 [Simkaniaceae bacterium]|nr:hypothetical protein [Simkaniaceae bacterium]